MSKDAGRYRSLVRLMLLWQRIETRGYDTPAVIAAELRVSERTARRYLDAVRSTKRIIDETKTARRSADSDQSCHT